MPKPAFLEERADQRTIDTRDWREAEEEQPVSEKTATKGDPEGK